MHENDLSFAIIGAAFEVHKYYGPGLFESVYQVALAKELVRRGLSVQSQVGIPVDYYGENLGIGFKADLIVGGKVIVEVKSIESVHDVHYKQLLTYLRLTDKKLGILINFNESNLQHGIRRVVNGLT